MYTNNELLFPHHVIPSLRRLRGPEWRALVDQIMKLPENHEETLAFMLMMIRLNGCMGCETDSYRAMRGCSACAMQTLRRYKGEDAELVDMYRQALSDVRDFAERTPALEIIYTTSISDRHGDSFQPSTL
jgi:hypothetical protein